MSDFKPANQTIMPMSADPGEEFPFLHTITVVDRVVSVDKPELVQNNMRTETVTLNLDSEWDGLSCMINIGTDRSHTSLLWNGDPVVIPASLMTNVGTLNVSVVGYGEDGALRAVTKRADKMFTVVESGYVEGDDPVPDPTTILGQLTEAADRANQAAENAESSTVKNVTVTMLPSGSDASGSVSDGTIALNIPKGDKGDKGDPGDKGEPGDLTTVAHDDTLDGDGTNSNPLCINQFVKLENNTDLNTLTTFGTYIKEWAVVATNAPFDASYSVYLVKVFNNSTDVTQIVIPIGGANGYINFFQRTYTASAKWSQWKQFATTANLNNYVPLSTYQALETKVQALEAQTTYSELPNNTDLYSLFGKTGKYVKPWGNTATNGPIEAYNASDTKYVITVISNRSNDSYMRIDPLAGDGVIYSYYITKTTSGVGPWYRIEASKVTA